LKTSEFPGLEFLVYESGALTKLSYSGAPHYYSKRGIKNLVFLTPIMPATKTRKTRFNEDERFMRLAIAQARSGIARGGPFGCVVARRGRVIARASNTVVRDSDATAHAEVKAIRAAGAELDTPFLSECTLYSTCEPCPMCFAASHWARIPRIVFGASIADATRAGFNEMRAPAAVLKNLTGEKIVLRGGVLRGECVALFKEWKRAGGKKY
jgi:tRNA(Arg) A34 adenosine deaminase TadA